MTRLQIQTITRMNLLGIVVLMIMLVACVRRAQPLEERLFVVPETTSQPASEVSEAPSSNPSPFITQPPASPTTEIYRDQPTQPRSQYQITAIFDFKAHKLSVSQAVDFINRTQSPLEELLFVVESNRQEGVFHLDKLEWDDGRAIDQYDLTGAILKIPLPSPLPPGRGLLTSMAYELHIPMRPGPLRATERQTNLSNWYPYVPPYDPETGWLFHDPSEVADGEHLTYSLSDYEVAIKFKDPQPGLVIAASAPLTMDGPWHTFRAPARRNFTWSVSQEYQTRSEQVGPVTVTSYYFPEHPQAGEAVLRATVDALSLFNEIFTPYPHESLTIVEADFPDGIEFDGLYYLGSNYYAAYTTGPQNFLTTLAAHETSHQWWYGLVGNDQASEPWLDESLATYSESLFFERYYPDLVDWWWEFRIGLYAPEGWVNSSIYEHKNYRFYVNAVYLRGAQFLQSVRETVGDKLFFEIIRSYLTQNSSKVTTAADFFLILETQANQDLQPLKDAYFKPGG